MTSQACQDCDPQSSTGSEANPSIPSPATAVPADSSSKATSVDEAALLDPSTFVPPDLGLGERAEYPRVVIEFCDRCRWLHRAVWTQTELFLTFPTSSATGLKAITLVPRTAPETGGRFRVWLYRYRTLEDEFAESEGKEKWDGAELIYDRKIEGGFPELKDLKQRIRNVIAPKQDLGHSDKAAFVKGAPAVQAEAAPTKPAEPEERAATEDDYTPRFRC